MANKRLLIRKQQKNVFFLLLLLLTPSVAFAGWFLDDIDRAFKNAILGSHPGWQTIITAVAKSLFWKLVLLDFTWTTIVWVKDRKEIGEMISGYVGKIFTIGFFWLLLMSAGTWIPAIIGLFADTGTAVATANKAEVGSLDAVFTQGLTLAESLTASIAKLGVFERIFLIFPAAFGAFCAAIGFALIAGQLLVTLIESYIAIGAGIIMLGFGGSRWTSDMATAYLKFAIGTGMKLMLCYLIIGLGFSLFDSAIAVSSIGSVSDYLAYVVRTVALVLIYVYLVFNIPGLASAIMSGSPNMSLGGMMGAAGAGKAAALGGAAGAQAGGMGKAAGAAFSANKASGMGNVASALMAPVPMIKSAAEMMGARAVDAGKGAVEGGKGALGKAGDAIDNSVGGRIAADIAGKSEAKEAGKTDGGDAGAPKTEGTPPADPIQAGIQKEAASIEQDANKGAAMSGSPVSSPVAAVDAEVMKQSGAEQIDANKPSAPKDTANPGAQPSTKTGGDKGSQLNTAPPGSANTAPPGSTNTAPQGSTGTAPPGSTNTAPPGSTNTAPPGSTGTGGKSEQSEGATFGGASDFGATPGTFLDQGQMLGEPPSALGGNEADQTGGDKGSQLGGNASGAKVGASDPQTRLLEAISANMEKMANAGGGERKPKLHEKISGLSKYVPQDGASVAAAPISMGHTRD